MINDYDFIECTVFRGNVSDLGSTCCQDAVDASGHAAISVPCVCGETVSYAVNVEAGYCLLEGVTGKEDRILCGDVEIPGQSVFKFSDSCDMASTTSDTGLGVPTQSIVLRLPNMDFIGVMFTASLLVDSYGPEFYSELRDYRCKHPHGSGSITEIQALRYKWESILCDFKTVFEHVGYLGDEMTESVRSIYSKICALLPHDVRLLFKKRLYVDDVKQWQLMIECCRNVVYNEPSDPRKITLCNTPVRDKNFVFYRRQGEEPDSDDNHLTRI